MVPSGDSTLLLLGTGTGERAELQLPPPKGMHSHVAPIQALTDTPVYKSKRSVVLRRKLNGFKISGRARESFWVPFKARYYLSVFDCWSTRSLERVSSLGTGILAVGAEGGHWNGTGHTFPMARAAAAALSAALLKAQLPGTAEAPPTHTMERSFTFYCSSTDSNKRSKSWVYFYMFMTFPTPLLPRRRHFPPPAPRPG